MARALLILGVVWLLAVRAPRVAADPRRQTRVLCTLLGAQLATLVVYYLGFTYPDLERHMSGSAYYGWFWVAVPLSGILTARMSAYATHPPSGVAADPKSPQKVPVATEGAQKPGLNLDQVGPRGENAIPDHINAQGDPTADVEEQLSKTLLDPTNPPEVRARAATDLGRMGPGAPIAWIALVTASYWDLEECVRRAAKDARTVRIEKVREAMRQPG